MKVKFPERMGTLCRIVERRSMNGGRTILVEFKADKFAVFAPDTYVQCAATYRGKLLEDVIDVAIVQQRLEQMAAENISLRNDNAKLRRIEARTKLLSARLADLEGEIERAKEVAFNAVPGRSEIGNARQDTLLAQINVLIGAFEARVNRWSVRAGVAEMERDRAKLADQGKIHVDDPVLRVPRRPKECEMDVKLRGPLDQQEWESVVAKMNECMQYRDMEHLKLMLLAMLAMLAEDEAGGELKPTNADHEMNDALAEHAALSPIAKYGGARGRDLDRLAESCERCAQAFAVCACHLHCNANEARENNAP